MLLFYQERKYLLISLITIILDGLILYFVPSYFNKINYFYPMLTISFLPFICFSNKKHYYLLVVIIGIIYDLLYSNIFLYNVIVFIILISIDNIIRECFKDSLIIFILLSLFNIVIYDTISFILILITSYQNINIYDLFYKINHSIILNIMSVFVLWFLLKKDIHHT